MQRDPALLEQLHDGDRGDDLRHRREPEDAVGRHRDALVGLAERLEVAHLPVPGDEDDGPLVDVLRQVALLQRVDVAQVRTGHPDLFRVDLLVQLRTHAASSSGLR